MYKIIIVCILIYIFSITSYSQLAYFESANAFLNNSNHLGYATLSHPLCSIKYGINKTFDIYLLFSTDPQLEPSYLGRYWHIPFFNSHICQISETQVYWRAPNGGKFIFVKSVSLSLKNKHPTYTQHGKAARTLHIYSPDEYSIEAEFDKDLKYTYEKNLLVKFCPGKEYDTYLISYSKQGYPLTVYNLKNKKDELTFSYKNNFLESIDLDKGRKRILFDFAISKGKEEKKLHCLRKLSHVKYQNNDHEYFTYSQKNSKRKLLNTDYTSGFEIDSKATVMVVTDEKDNSKGWLEWDVDSGVIIADNGGTYSTTNNAQYSNTNSSDSIGNKESHVSAVAYQDKNKKYQDIKGKDSEEASTFYQNGDTGEQRKIYRNPAPGKSYMTIRKVLTRKSEGYEWKVFENRIYSDTGKLIRKVRQNQIIEYKYLELKNGINEQCTFINGTLVNKKRTYDSFVIENIDFLSDGNVEKSEYSNSDGKNILVSYLNNNFICKKIFIGGWSAKYLKEMEDNHGTKTYFKYQDGILENLEIHSTGEKILSLYIPESKTFIKTSDISLISTWIKSLKGIYK